MRKFSAHLRNQARNDGFLYKVESSGKPIGKLPTQKDKQTRKKRYLLTQKMDYLRERYYHYTKVMRIPGESIISQNLLAAEISKLEFEIQDIELLGGGKKDV